MAIRIGEVAGIAAPERLLAGLRQRCAGCDCFLQHTIDGGFVLDVAGECDAGEPRRRIGDLCVGCKIGPAKEGEQRAPHIQK